MKLVLRFCGILAAIVGVTAFVAALAFPAVGTCYRGSDGALPNWFENQNIIFFGWLAAAAGQVGWFANVPFALNIHSLLRGARPNGWFIVLEAGLLGFAVFSLQPRLGLRLPHNEGYDEAICYLGTGFWLWVMAHGVVLAATIALRLSSGPNVRNDS